MTPADGLVLAHYGGVPEVLTFAVPAAVVAAFVLLERRARQRARSREEEEAEQRDV